MNKREAKRIACGIARALVERGGDFPEALYDAAAEAKGRYSENALKLERAYQELIDELHRRSQTPEEKKT